MFFDKEYISFRVLDVVELKQENISTFMSGRNFDALSFRFSADTVLSSGGQILHAQDNSLCFMPSRLDYTREAKCDDLIAVHLDVQNYFSSEIELIYPEEAPAVAELFLRALSLWNAKGAGYKYRCAAVVNEIFALCREENRNTHGVPEAIAASVAFMQENFADASLTVPEIATKSFISEVYFRRLFKEAFGTSPAKYLINLRIGHAIGLMSTGYYTLKEVAFLSGYADYTYFSSEFKRIKGVSPTQYLYNY